jgi:hypothetical protein
MLPQQLNGIPQHEVARKQANEIKSLMSRERRKLKALGRPYAVALLHDPPDHVARMKLGIFLGSLPRFKDVRAQRVVNRAGIPYSCLTYPLGKLTDRQRRVLAEELA